MDKTKALTLGILSIVVMLALLVFSLAGQTAQKLERIIPTRPRECGPLIQSCRAETSLKLESCSVEKAHTKLADALGTPLSVGECAAVKARLPRRCPDGCELDYSSIMAVPGKLEVAGSGKPDESERCEFRGSRQVSIRAMCKPSAAP